MQTLTIEPYLYNNCFQNILMVMVLSIPVLIVSWATDAAFCTLSIAPWATCWAFSSVIVLYMFAIFSLET